MRESKNDLRQRLRAATAQSHAKLDLASGGGNIFDEPTNYCRYLRSMRQLYTLFDCSLMWVENAAGLPQRDCSMISLIDHDLRTFPQEVANTSRFDQFLNLSRSTQLDNSVAATWGQAYVLEGSALGGNFLAKQAEWYLPSKFGKSFLDQLAIDSANRWPRFIEALKKVELDYDEICAAAVATFDVAYEIFIDEYARNAVRD